MKSSRPCSFLSMCTIKGLILTVLIVISCASVLANTLIDKGGAFYIELATEEKAFPLLVINDAMDIQLSDDISLNLSGMGKDEALSKVNETISDLYDVKSINYFKPENLITISVLGDIQNPGKYPVPEESLLSQLNSYYTLFNNANFDADFTLVRDGQRTFIPSENLYKWDLRSGDAVLISLHEKKLEKTNTQNKKKIVGNDSLNQLSEPENLSPEEEPQDNGSNASEIPQQSSNTADRFDANLDMSLIRMKDLDHYQIQPGDIMDINLPGETVFNKSFLIGRDGMIDLPEIGPLKVAGLTLSEADKAIYTVLSEVFLGLDKLTVHLKEKRLLVTVLGFVKNPGEFELPSTGNIQMAITEAGGFVEGAQLNKLQLRRDGKKIVFNFKRYLDSGDPADLPEIKSLDEIFVPTSPGLSNVYGEAREVDNKGLDSVSDRSVIKVFGEVVRPVSFPYQEGVSIVDAILKGGGVTRYANVEQIRLLSGTEPKLFNLKQYLDSGRKEDLPLLEPGATIYVAQQVDSVSGGARKVYVMGQVQNPGAFETSEDVGFLDVVAISGGPTRYADIRAVRILKSDGGVVPFNFQDFTEGRSKQLPEISSGDAIFFPEKGGDDDDKSWLKLETKDTIKIIGAVHRPGRFEWANSVDLIDYLSNAGGPTDKADLANVRIIAPGPNGERILTEFNMQEFINFGGSWSSMPTVPGGATVIIPELPENPTSNTSNWVKLPKENAIYVMGSVVAPGRYAFNDDMGFLDILSAAEGPSGEADMSRIRVVHRNEGAPKVSKLNLLRYFETGDESLLPKVKRGDTIFVASKSRKWVEKSPEDTVRIMGAVFKSGRYEFTNNMTILDLIAEAGGPKETAYIEKILIVNNSCCENRATTFDLVDFMKSPNSAHLPVLMAGDTVFIPELSQSNWNIFNDLVSDVAGILNVFLMLTNLGWMSP